MTRLRKAYAVAVDGYDDAALFYAPTAAKAKYAAYLAVSDCDSGVSFQHLHARRSPANDVTLPDEHRLAADLSAEDRHVLMHAYGGTNFGKEGHRDHFCTDPADRRLLRLAWELGLFTGPHGERYADGARWSGAFFYLTELGRQVARSLVPTYQA